MMGGSLIRKAGQSILKTPLLFSPLIWDLPLILDGIDEQGQISEQAKNQVEQMLKSAFRPEFLNRLDEIVFYKPLTKDEIIQIVELMLVDLKKRLAEKELGLAVTDAAKSLIVQEGYDPIYGARPLKRYIQQKLETLLARYILEKDPKPETVLKADCVDGQLVISE